MSKNRLINRWKNINLTYTSKTEISCYVCDFNITPTGKKNETKQRNQSLYIFYIEKYIKITYYTILYINS